MIAITLRRIMECRPCYDPIEKGIFEKDHDLDAPISFRWLSERIPPQDLIWCFYHLPDEHAGLNRHFAVDCAERVKNLMTDERSLNALVVARNYALGKESHEELTAAWNAAMDAANVAKAAYNAAEAAASTAMAAASDAAIATANAVCDSSNAACDDELRWQSQRIISLTDAGEWSPVGENK